MTDQPYVYQPLDVSSQCIRLLRILRVPADDKIQLSIEHVNADEVDGDYDAVSYAWGEDDASHKVWINGRYLLLRENIWQFLKHQSESGHTDASTRLWIDSICIDQSNGNEKNHQVPFMRKIYGQARRVLVWLGNESFGGHLARLSNTSLKCPTVWEHNEGAAEEFVDWFKELGAIDAAARYPCLTLLDNIYWTRLWIVQEVVLARSAFVVCGQLLIDFQGLPSMINTRSLDRYHRSLQSPEAPYNVNACRNSSEPLKRMVKFSRDKKPQLLIDLLQRYYKQSCDKPHDKVYGLLGLTMYSERFPVDYSLEIEELFIRCLEFFQLQLLASSTNALSTVNISAPIAQRSDYSKIRFVTSHGEMWPLITALDMTLKKFYDWCSKASQQPSSSESDARLCLYQDLEDIWCGHRDSRSWDYSEGGGVLSAAQSRIMMDVLNNRAPSWYKE